MLAIIQSPLRRAQGNQIFESNSVLQIKNTIDLGTDEPINSNSPNNIRSNLAPTPSSAALQPLSPDKTYELASTKVLNDKAANNSVTEIIVKSAEESFGIYGNPSLKQLKPAIIRLPPALQLPSKTRSKSVHFSTSVSIISSINDSCSNSPSNSSNSSKVEEDIERVDHKTLKARRKITREHRKRHTHLLHKQIEIPHSPIPSSPVIYTRYQKSDNSNINGTSNSNTSINSNSSNGSDNNNNKTGKALSPILQHQHRRSKTHYEPLTSINIPTPATIITNNNPSDYGNKVDEKNSISSTFLSSSLPQPLPKPIFILPFEQDLAFLNMPKIVNNNGLDNNPYPQKKKIKYLDTAIIPGLYHPPTPIQPIRIQLSEPLQILLPLFTNNKKANNSGMITAKEFSEKLYSALLNNYLAVEMSDPGEYNRQITQLRLFLLYSYMGEIFIKFGRRGKPHRRRVRIIIHPSNPNNPSAHDWVLIDWSSNSYSTDRKCLTALNGRLDPIFQRSQNLSRSVDNLCFALSAGECLRSICLQAETEDLKKIWIQGIELIKKFLK